jgi:hypothetical protein
VSVLRTFLGGLALVERCPCTGSMPLRISSGYSELVAELAVAAR